ncbi:CBS domain-containing protein [Alkalithermobacter thermoalcaliphilus JW-YL-7 = DSM 7308]|uniref:CBS domain-containing protein n=1 Tax=Alkalithermobacter thermoalcaliphilus JW-YL-7 = DSM 7308 TaxID=1121328 RepID=A0A150FNS3_CLOPD|nr:putative signal transduction protein with CBS domain containing protein [[Clostridium] paradoxum JW-YL-7 = DSM 7308]SHK84717.1 CBS domain-containing protein [[Clostridium] paradoxum JW-YL-7 = DSM 7308]
MKVKDVMTTDVSYLSSSSSIFEAANIMRQLNVGAVPICDEANSPVGVVTDRDIVLRSVANNVHKNENVGSIMSSNIVTVSPDTDVHEAARLMAKHQIRRLPVVENGKLVGIVSLGDLAVEKIHVDEAGNALSDISKE